MCVYLEKLALFYCIISATETLQYEQVLVEREKKMWQEGSLKSDLEIMRGSSGIFSSRSVFNFIYKDTHRTMTNLWNLKLEHRK